MTKERKPKLTMLQERFIAAFLRNGSNSKQAAIEAGYSKKNAEKAAYLVHKHPLVKAAIDAARKEIRTLAVYDSQAAMQEADRLLKLAEDNRQSPPVENRFQIKAILPVFLLININV